MKNYQIFIGLGAGLIIGGIIIFSLKKNTSINKKVKSILFIGDSNTAANFSYADKLKKQFPSLTIKKIAMNGAKTDWMKNELQKELKNKKYDAVFILGGSNDIYATGKIDQTKLNLEQMYLMAKNSGSVVVAVTPPNKNFYINKTEQKQKLLNDLIYWIKNNSKKDYIIDFHYITNDKNLFSSQDGYLHPQSKAHDILSKKAKEILNLE